MACSRVVRRSLACLLLLAAVSGCSSSAGTLGSTSSAGSLVPRGDTESGWRVERVVDGDTLLVTRDGREERVRMIGIDTPETVKPGSPIECFGPEASDFAKDSLSGRDVVLEYDATAGLRDRYDRVLAYVWLDGRLFNLESIRGGFAEQRLYGQPYAWYAEFVAADALARDAGIGRWGAC